MSIERKARVLNGMLVATAAILTLGVDQRFAWMAVFMGGSLIFSGTFDYCGFAKILQRLQR